MAKHFFRPFLLVAAFLTVGILVYQGRNNFRSVYEATVADLIYVSLLVIAGNLLASEQFHAVYSAAGIRLSRRRNFAIFCVGAFANLLPGQVGTFGRLSVLNRTFSLSYSRHISILLYLALVGSGFGLIFASVALVLHLSVSWSPALFSLLLAIGFAIAIMLTIVRAIWASSRLIDRWPRIRDGHETFRVLLSQETLTLRLLITEIGINICLSLRFYVLLEVFGSTVPFACLIATSSLARAATSIAPTPGALGVREIVVGFALSSGGGALTVGVLAGGLDRAVHFTFLSICSTLIAGTEIFLHRRGRGWLSTERSGCQAPGRFSRRGRE